MENKLRFDVKTNQKLFVIAAKIDQYKGKWQQLEKKENRYLKELRTLATIQSIGSSTRIEGATLTNEEVETLLKNMKVTKFRTRDEQEVGGYYDALSIVLDQFEHIELSVSNIKTLHNYLLKYSEKDQKHKGEYKHFTNKVVANYPDGHQRTIFNTTEPHLVDKQMGELLEWTTQALANQDFHALFVIATFVYEFLSIHPFQDGNGRLSRLLTLLLLLREGYDFVQYISFEDIIEKRKSDYYRALMAGQQKRGTDEEIISEWMLFFLSCLEEIIIKLNEKYERYLTVGGYLNERQRNVLEHIRQNGVVVLSDLIPIFNNVSKKTISRDLEILESEYLLEKIGNRKSASYRAVK
jgi:Fic family protein